MNRLFQLMAQPLPNHLEVMLRIRLDELKRGTVREEDYLHLEDFCKRLHYKVDAQHKMYEEWRNQTNVEGRV